MSQARSGSHTSTVTVRGRPRWVCPRTCRRLFSETPVGSEPPVTLKVSRSDIGVGRGQRRQRIPDGHRLGRVGRIGREGGRVIGQGFDRERHAGRVAGGSGSHTSTVAVKGPSSVGVPENVPLALSVTPVGSDPPVTLKVSRSESASVAARAVSGSPTVTVWAVLVGSAVKAGALLGSGSTVTVKLVVAHSGCRIADVDRRGPGAVLGGRAREAPVGLEADAGRQRAAGQAERERIGIHVGRGERCQRGADDHGLRGVGRIRRELGRAVGRWLGEAADRPNHRRRKRGRHRPWTRSPCRFRNQ